MDDLMPVYMNPRTAEWVVLQLRKLSRISGGQGVRVTSSAAGISIDVDATGEQSSGRPRTEATIALTDAGSADGLYAAEEVWYNADDEEWQSKTGGMVWAVADPDDGRVWMGELRETAGLVGLESDTTPRRAWLESNAEGLPRWSFGNAGGGAAIELFKVQSQTSTKIVGKMIVGLSVPDGAAEVDLLTPFLMSKVEANDTVAAFQRADATWRVVFEPPVGGDPYFVLQEDDDGYLIMDYVRAAL